MVKIRLMRLGSRHNPFYRVVVMDTRAPQKSRFIENLGYYDPTKNPQLIELKEERVAHWLGCGAQPTDTARSLFRKRGILRRIHEARTGTSSAEGDGDGEGSEAESSES